MGKISLGMQILYKNETAKKQFCSEYKKKWRYPEQVKRKLESAENFILNAESLMDYECLLESEPRARLILSHLCSFESEPPKHRSSNNPDGRSPHSYQGHRI